MHTEDHYVLDAIRDGVRGFVIKTQAAEALFQAFPGVASRGFPSIARPLSCRACNPRGCERPLGGPVAATESRWCGCAPFVGGRPPRGHRFTFPIFDCPLFAYHTVLCASTVSLRTSAGPPGILYLVIFPVAGSSSTRSFAVGSNWLNQTCPVESTSIVYGWPRGPPGASYSLNV